MNKEVKELNTVRKRRTKLELARLGVEVINLRRVGTSFAEIASQLQTPVATCYRVFKKAIDQIPRQSAIELQLQQYERLEEIFRISMKNIEDERTGPQYAKQALDALKQIADLNGLNAPVVSKTELTGKDGGAIKVEQGLTREDIEAMSDEERAVFRTVLERKVKMQKQGSLH